MRNSIAPKKSQDLQTNIIYHFRCPDDACQRRSESYIGLTTTTMKRRMQGHRNSGAIHEHYTDVHGRKPQVAELTNNTTIIHREPTSTRLRIAEAVSIELQRPTLNIQSQFDLVLPSSRRRAVHHAPAGQGRDESQSVTASQQAQRDEDAAAVTEPTPTQPQGSNIRAGGRRQLRNLPERDYRE